MTKKRTRRIGLLLTCGSLLALARTASAQEKPASLSDLDGRNFAARVEYRF